MIGGIGGLESEPNSAHSWIYKDKLYADLTCMRILLIDELGCAEF